LDGTRRSSTDHPRRGSHRAVPGIARSTFRIHSDARAARTDCTKPSLWCSCVHCSPLPARRKCALRNQASGFSDAPCRLKPTARSLEPVHKACSLRLLLLLTVACYGKLFRHFSSPAAVAWGVCVPAVEVPTIRKTALNAVHRQMGARMVEFNGWDMPVEYPASLGGGIISEHLAVRTGVGIFDVSHMGDIRLAGPQALAAVQHISMNDAAKLALGQAQYSALLYPQGTFVDDVIVHRLGEEEYLLVINAGTREKDFNWVRDNTRQFDCAVENLSDDFTQIAIQGPKGVNLLQKLTDVDLSAVKFYWVARGTVCGLRDILIARTGYT